MAHYVRFSFSLQTGLSQAEIPQTHQLRDRLFIYHYLQRVLAPSQPVGVGDFFLHQPVDSTQLNPLEETIDRPNGSNGAHEKTTRECQEGGRTVVFCLLQNVLGSQEIDGFKLGVGLWVIFFAVPFEWSICSHI